MNLQTRDNCGILVPLSVYRKLKAFQHGGVYWDQQPQDLVRQYLGEILPPVETVVDGKESCGLFRRFDGGIEVVSRSRKVGSSGVPKKELARLANAVNAMRRAAEHPDTQPHNRMLLRNFRLPNPELDPDLYRLSGPLWKRRLHIIWGCEQTQDSSIAPEQATNTLKADQLHLLRLALFWLGLLGLLAALIWAIVRFGPVIGSRASYIVDRAPTAGVVVVSRDNPARSVALDLSASRDSDGRIAEHRVDWGDGSFSQIPPDEMTAKKTYDKDGDYPVTVTAIDDKGKPSEPTLVPVKFDHDAQMAAAGLARQQKEAEESTARRAQEEADRKAAEESERAAELAEKKRIAEEDAYKAVEERVLREAREKAASQAEEAARARAAKEAAEQEEASADAGKQLAKSPANSGQHQSGDESGIASFQDSLTGRPIKPLKFTRPLYPRNALNEGIEGSVTVEFVVDVGGRVKDIKVVESKNGQPFEPAVLRSLQNAKFRPLLIDGRPAEQKVRRTFAFTITK